MDLSRLLQLIESSPSYRRLVAALPERAPGGHEAVVLEAPALPGRGPLRVPPEAGTAGHGRPENARKLQEQLAGWCGVTPWLFPEADTLPYERLASDMATEMERVRVLSALADDDDAENDDEDRPALVIASAAALMSRTATREDFGAACHQIKIGDNVAPSRLLGDWAAMGYRLENVVEVPGAMSHRGGIVDIWPPTVDAPARLEFFGDSIDSLRRFAPAPQRSTGKIASLFVGPAVELLAPRRLAPPALENILNSLTSRL
jgi:transcription-repair coupling factor (superfamily II helicase)